MTRNEDARAHGEPEPTSPPKRFAAGFLLGAAIDAAVIVAAISLMPDLDFGCGHSEC
jgi:hypothetical protein